MKAIGVIGNVEELFCIKSGSTFKLGIFLKDEVPSGDVTATLTSVGGKFTVTTPLTFTSGNYTTAQGITITAVEDSVVEGYGEDTLNISLSGGGYSGVSKQVTIRINDSGMEEFFVGGYNWKKGINQSLNKTAARAAIELFIYNGGSKPSNAIPNNISTGYTGDMHSMVDGGIDITDLSSVTSITQTEWVVLDRLGAAWTFYGYHIFNSSKTKDVCAFVHLGHGSEGKASTIAAIQNRLDNGYDVMFCAMPKANYLVTGGNTEASGLTNNHKDLFTDGLATNEVPHLYLYHSSIVQILNYLDTNFDYTTYGIVGISGGGWTVTTICSYELRFTINCSIRYPSHRRCDRFENTGHWNGESDYEQGGAEPNLYVNCGITVFDFYSTYSYPVLLALCGGDSGRKAISCLHSDDETIGLGGYFANMWGPIVESMAANWGGECSVYLDTDPGRTAHAYDSFSLGKIEELFGDS